MATLKFPDALWPRLSARLDDALELSVAERAAWLDGLAPDDADLRPYLADILAESAQPTDGNPQSPALFVPEADGLRPGDIVGPWRLVGLLGQGGMGTVWLARRADGLLYRPVALKLPRAGAHERALAGYLARERDLVASLEHPNIARLYDAGIAADGRSYLALELVAGQRIDAWCRERALAARAILELFLQVARAAAYAHARLIVHCDLKPSNLLVGDDGQVKLLDFGVARLLLDAGVPTTRGDAGARAFTPEYAAPEQVASGTGDTRADIWSLGVVLHELLTGVRLPASRSPSVPGGDRDHASHLHPDLTAILDKALRLLPGERYATVDAMADDIQRHLDRRPVLARPATLRYVLGKAVSRHRVAFAVAGVAAIAIVMAAAVALWQAHRAEGERARADQVKEFVTRLLRDAGPYRLAAADWRSMRLMSRLMRDASGASGDDAGWRTALDLLRHAADEVDRATASPPAVRAELRRVIAEGLASFGEADRAGRLIEASLDESRRLLSADHPETLRARLMQVQLHRWHGRHANAEGELAAMLPGIRARAASDPGLMASALQLSALVSLDRGDTGTALAIAAEAATMAARLDPRHPDRAAAITLQSIAARAAGRHEDARMFALQALELLGPAVDGRSDPRRGEALAAAGRAAADLGDAGAAVDYLDAALVEVRRSFGAGHPVAGFMQQGIVSHELELGRIASADARSAEAMGIMTKHLRPGTWPYDIAAASRASVLLALERPGQALALLDPALVTIRRVLGAKHDITVRHEVNRIHALAALGRVDEASTALARIDASIVDSAPSEGTRARLTRARALVDRLAGASSG